MFNLIATKKGENMTSEALEHSSVTEQNVGAKEQHPNATAAPDQLLKSSTL